MQIAHESGVFDPEGQTSSLDLQVGDLRYASASQDLRHYNKTRDLKCGVKGMTLSLKFHPPSLGFVEQNSRFHKTHSLKTDSGKTSSSEGVPMFR